MRNSKKICPKIAKFQHFSQNPQFFGFDLVKVKLLDYFTAEEVESSVIHTAFDSKTLQDLMASYKCVD